MRWQRIKQFVREKHTFDGVGEVGRGRNQLFRDFAKGVTLRGARSGADLDQVESQPFIHCGVVPPNRTQDIRRQPAVSRAGLDEIKSGLGARDSGLEQSSHFENLLSEKRAEDGSDVDAGKKIARAARSLGGAGVVTDVGIVEREVHERGHSHRAAFLNELANPS
jgi:hypothetical protein